MTYHTVSLSLFSRASLLVLEHMLCFFYQQELLLPQLDFLPSLALACIHNGAQALLKYIAKII